MLNRNLNELKKIFDRIESYDLSQNIGMRSLKNIGVWLCVYALMDDKDQHQLMTELAAKAGLKEANSYIKKIVDELILPPVLAEIIKDYEAANGSFTLSVNTPENQKKLLSKIHECQLRFLSSHVKCDPLQGEDTPLIFLMKNEIKFNWAASGAKSSRQLDTTGDLFNGTFTHYLTADSKKHEVVYNLVEFNTCLFHVVRLATLQNTENPVRCDAWLIESVNPADAAFLQKDYFEIIEKAKKRGFNAKKTYELVANKRVNNLETIGEGEGEFEFRVRFPKIAEPLKTTEKRLGIYADFKKKTIANIFVQDLFYEGVRELKYDKKGGEIKNRERVHVKLAASWEPPSYIQYTVRNPFMMIYEAVNGSDYYPYFIADPNKNLELTFSSSSAYPDQQKTIGFASQGQSVFSLKNTISPVVSKTMDAPSPKDDDCHCRII